MTSAAYRSAAVIVVGVAALGDRDDVVDLVGVDEAAGQPHLTLVLVSFEDPEAQSSPSGG